MLVVGATGYIGKYVVKELMARGYDVVVFARSSSGIGGKATASDTKTMFQGADVRFGDVTNVQSLASTAFTEPVDVVVSCLASRTGGKKDSWLVDYQATSNVLQAACAAGAQHFVLLSAICVQKPELEFQRAKLKLESELMAAGTTGDITYSIVRPTAFFKSLAGQVELVKDGKPFVMFGDGELASCKPISEADLAAFMADCIDQRDKVNQVLPIGGACYMYWCLGDWLALAVLRMVVAHVFLLHSVTLAVLRMVLCGVLVLLLYCLLLSLLPQSLLAMWCLCCHHYSLLATLHVTNA